MENNLLYMIIGWLGSIGLILGYLPQAIQTIRTRQTDGISLPGFCMMAIGSLCFMSQGLMLCIEQGVSTGIFFFITNLITTVCATVIFIIKMHNDYFKK
ncbi:MAG: PQ-loop repeat-containing protein [Bacteroidales bacterium]|jgi:MtN3 and saliva related transmembrane protein|nr:PQ-loop repeat-containing protein [Bacteroidales bacterium]